MNSSAGHCDRVHGQALPDHGQGCPTSQSLIREVTTGGQELITAFQRSLKKNLNFKFKMSTKVPPPSLALRIADSSLAGYRCRYSQGWCHHHHGTGCWWYPGEGKQEGRRRGRRDLGSQCSLKPTSPLCLLVADPELRILAWRR